MFELFGLTPLDPEMRTQVIARLRKIAQTK
jgi:hypothetical protein